MTDENENLHPAERRIKERQTIEELRARIAELEAAQAQPADEDDEYDDDGYGYAPAAESEPFEIPAEEIAAHERVSAAATPTAPPPAPATELQSIHYQVQNAPASEMHPGSALYKRTLEAIQKAGIHVGSGLVEHTGQFGPLE